MRSTGMLPPSRMLTGWTYEGVTKRRRWIYFAVVTNMTARTQGDEDP
jgi:hypothetical protein